MNKFLLDNKELIRNYEELREFIKFITLQLQRHRSLTDNNKDELFQKAYKLYTKHRVEDEIGYL